MADNYAMFSEAIENLSEEEEDWFSKIIDFVTSEVVEDTEALALLLVEHGIEWGEDVDIEDFPQFDFNLGNNEEGSGICWLTCEEHFNADHVVMVVQAFIRKFRPEMIFKMTYSETCSKPRVGEFGGGWVVVSRDEVAYGNTWDGAREAEAGLRGKKEK